MIYSRPQDVKIGEEESDKWWAGWPSNISKFVGAAGGAVGGGIGGMLLAGPVGAAAGIATGAAIGGELMEDFGDMFEPDPVSIMQEQESIAYPLELMEGSGSSPNYAQEYGVQNLYGFRG